MNITYRRNHVVFVMDPQHAGLDVFHDPPDRKMGWYLTPVRWVINDSNSILTFSFNCRNRKKESIAVVVSVAGAMSTNLVCRSCLTVSR